MENKTWIDSLKKAWPRYQRVAGQIAMRGLSLLVVACTVASLVTPAMTLTIPVSCGMEEHTHTQECYGEPVLVCGQEEAPPHEHTAGCYTQQSDLMCGQEEGDSHQHTADCYIQQEVLACTQQVTEGHAHTDACYQQTLICDMQEHVHTAACREQGEQPGEAPEPEVTPEPSATPDAAATPEPTVSPEPSATPDAAVTPQPSAEPEETPDPEADLETAEEWQAMADGLELTGVWADDLLAVAAGQLGYAESTRNYIQAEEGARKGYTRYGAWLGEDHIYDDWGAAFVAFCLSYARISEDAMPTGQDAAAWAEALQAEEFDLYRGAGEYTPVPGDLAFLSEAPEQETVPVQEQEAPEEEAGGAVPEPQQALEEPAGAAGQEEPAEQAKEQEEPRPAYVGIVTALNEEENTVTILLGDWEDAVAELTLPLDDEQLLGYGMLPQNPELVQRPMRAPVRAAEIDGRVIVHSANISDEPAEGTPYGAWAGNYNNNLNETKVVTVPGALALKVTIYYSTESTSYDWICLWEGAHADYKPGNSSNYKTSIAGTDGKLGGGSSKTPGAPWTGVIEGDTATIGFRTDGSGNTYYGYYAIFEPYYDMSVFYPAWHTEPLDDGSYAVVFDGAGDIQSFFQSSSVLETLEEQGVSIEQVTEVRLNEGITSISEKAFGGWASLERIVFPQACSLTEIPDRAFAGCSGLTEIVIPNGITKLGSSVFEGCTGLAKAVLPDGVKIFGTAIFKNCTNLRDVTLPQGLTAIPNSIFYNCKSLAEINIPESVTSIGPSAFYGCSSLAGVEFPASVTSIGSSAFYGCSSLAGVVLPAGITKIEEKTFYGCSSLVEIAIPEGVASIGSYAFSYSGLTSIVVPGNVQEIRDNAFYRCLDLKSAVILDGVRSLGVSVFSYCENLEKVQIADSVEAIGNYAFSRCRKLTELKLPENPAFTTINGGSDRWNGYFYECVSLHELVIPESVKTLTGYVFNGGALTRVTLPDGLEMLGSLTFEGSSVKEVVWSASNVSEGITAKAAKTWKLLIPPKGQALTAGQLNSLHNCGMRDIAFWGEGTISFPEGTSASNLPGWAGRLAAGSYYIAEDGSVYLLRDDGAVLVHASVKTAGYTIPQAVNGKTVIGVGSYAFEQAYELTKLTFEKPECITELASYAFANASSLASINGCTTEVGLKEFFREKSSGVQLGIGLVRGTQMQSLPDESVYAYELETDPVANTVSNDPRTTSITLTFNTSDSAYKEIIKESEQEYTALTGRTFTLDFKLNTNILDPKDLPQDTDEEIRIYIRFTGTGGMVGGGFPIGEESIIAGQAGNNLVDVASMTLHEIEKGRLYCMSIKGIYTGATASNSFSLSYPSAYNQPGGDALVWCTVAPSAQEITAADFGILPEGKTMWLSWVTQRDEYYLNPNSRGSTERYPSGYQNKDLKVSAKYQDGQTLLYLEDTYIDNYKRDSRVRISYFPQLYNATNRHENTSENSRVGIQYATGVDYVQTVTLSDGLRFPQKFVEDVLAGNYTVRSAYSYYYNTVDTITTSGGELSFEKGWLNVSLKDVQFEFSEDRKTMTLRYSDLNRSMDEYGIPKENLASYSFGKVSGIQGAWLTLPYLELEDSPQYRKEGQTFTITSTLEGTVNYPFSPSQKLPVCSTVAEWKEWKQGGGQAAQQSCTEMRTATLQRGEVTVSKTGFSGELRSSGVFTLLLKNTDIEPSEPYQSISDPIPADYYLRAQDIENLFKDNLAQTDEELTITITHAQRIAPEYVPERRIYYFERADSRFVHEYTSENVQEKYGAYAYIFPQLPQYISNNAPLAVCTTEYATKGQEGTITIRWQDQGRTALRMEYRQAEGLLDRILGDYEVIEDIPPTQASIQEAFDKLRFIVSAPTEYHVEWRWEEGKVVQAGSELTRKLYAALKDTFMRLPVDRVGNLNGDLAKTSVDIAPNVAYFTPVDPFAAPLEYVYKGYAQTEIWLQPSVVKDSSGNVIGEDGSSSLKVGDRLSCTLRCGGKYLSSRYGGSYLMLGVQLQPGQTVLAEKNNNPALASQGLRVVTLKNIEYYVLEQQGVYHNVKLNGKTADTVTVVGQGAGQCTTEVKFYMSGSNMGSSGASVEFYMLAGGEGGLPTEFRRTAWLGDHYGRRLYQGSVFKVLRSSKAIVATQRPGKPVQQIAPATFSLLHEGESVTYRLQVSLESEANSGTDSYAIIKGSEIQDNLPLTIPGCEWTKDNVTVMYKGQPMEDGCWEIVTKSSSSQSVSQYIRWNDNLELTVANNAPCEIFVTLTYPSGEAWQKYFAKYGSASLTNTFVRQGISSSVTHQFVQNSVAVLRKGVLKTGYEYSKLSVEAYAGTRYTSVTGSLMQTDSRLLYINNDAATRTVTYYISVYNASPSRVYLTEIQDILPDGFTLKRMGGSSYDYSSRSGTSMAQEDKYTTSWGNRYYTVQTVEPYDEGYHYLAANITAHVISQDEQQLLRFTFSQPSSVSSGLRSVGYDAATGLCYLERGEAVVFQYTCCTNGYADTEDIAVNAAAMPYYNYSDNELSLAAGKVIHLRQNTGTDDSIPNDGEAYLWSNDYATGVAGFVAPTAYAGDTQQWLASDVQMERGELKPGIDKKLVSVLRTDVNTHITTELKDPTKEHLTSADVLKWEVTATNEGGAPIYDYVLSDVMQSPYLYTGELQYRLNVGSAAVAQSWFEYYPKNIPWEDVRAEYQAEYEKNEKNQDSNWPEYRKNLWAQYTLLRFGEWTLDENNQPMSVRVTGYSTHFSPQEQWPELAVNGPEVKFTTRYWKATSVNGTQETTFYASLTQSKSGALALHLRFPDEQMAIPAYGSATLTLCTKTALKNVFVSNYTYTNLAYLTPLAQPWGEMAAGERVLGYTTPFNQDEPMDAVRDSATATISGIEVTTSKLLLKQGDNTADSIYLNTLQQQGDEPFTYELSVVNNQEAGTMKRLVMIDTLPYVNDHTAFFEEDSRGSQFAAEFAASLNPVVVVKDEEGEERSLVLEEDYEIYLSDKTEFALNDWTDSEKEESKPQGWKTLREAMSEEGWQQKYKTIRLVVKETASKQIGENETVILRFDCEVGKEYQGNLTPGMTAWNSFGYMYMNNADKYYTASPGKVGAIVPGVPELTKLLRLASNKPFAAEGAESFRFLIYRGAKVAGVTGDQTDQEIAEALDKAGRAYMVITVDVKEGDSASVPQLLENQHVWRCGLNGFEPTEQLWDWMPKEGDKKYTILELGSESMQSGEYLLGSINNSSKNPVDGLTFTYVPEINQQIKCTNIRSEWQLLLHKIDADNLMGLPGAVFALYSPEEKDKMEDEAVADWQETYSGLDDTYTENGTAYYLMDIRTTNNGGMIDWSGLLRGEYAYCELRAPDGYRLKTGYTVVTKPADGNSVSETVTNRLGYEMPKTGGVGTMPFILSGTAVMLGALLLWNKRRRTGEVDAS